MVTNRNTGTIARLIVEDTHSPGPGISSTARWVTIVHDGGRHAPTDARPAVRLVTRVIFGNVYRHFEPVEPPAPGWFGYMASGAWVVIDGDTSRRIGLAPAAYQLHDRCESRAEYAEIGQ